MLEGVADVSKMASAILLLTFGFVLSIFIVFGVYNKVFKYYRLCKAVKKIPGLPTHWLWGNLHQMELTEAFGMKMYHWRIENNTHIERLWLGPFDAVVHLAHPTHLKKLLNEPKAENIYSMLEPWLGSGLLIANGSRWHRSRRLLTPAFHFDILKPYVHVYNECTEVLLSKWQKNAEAGLPVNVCQSIRNLTLDILLQCACSYKSGCQEEYCSDRYVQAVERLVFLTAERFMSPILQSSSFLYFYCTPQGWQCRRALKQVHKESEKIILERKRTLKEMDNTYHKKKTSDILKLAKSSRKFLDFLDILLAAQDETGCGLTDFEVRCEVDTFMFEGHDTTANGIIFALYLLARNPEHQEKCREEVNNVLRGRSRFDYDDLPKLQYTLWCIKESLRLYSPVFNIFRRLTQDVELDGYLIPEGAWVSIDLLAIHLCPEIWDEPFEFNPLRFHPDNVKSRPPYAYVPFSAGPRNCIGQNFALDEARVVIGTILNKFCISLTSNEKVEYVPKVVLRPSKEVQLNLVPLQKDM